MCSCLNSFNGFYLFFLWGYVSMKKKCGETLGKHFCFGIFTMIVHEIPWTPKMLKPKCSPNFVFMRTWLKNLLVYVYDDGSFSIVLHIKHLLFTFRFLHIITLCRYWILIVVNNYRPLLSFHPMIMNSYEFQKWKNRICLWLLRCFAKFFN